MLRHGRLRDAELRTDDRRDLAGTSLVVGQQVQDATADRVPQNIERVHSPFI